MPGIGQRPEDHSDIKVDIAILKKEVEAAREMMKRELDTVNSTLKTLVTRIEFTPIKIIVYGLVGSIMTGVLGAILANVIRK
jgi:hypothetical protein